MDSISVLVDQILIDSQSILLYAKGIIEILPQILDELKRLNVPVTGIQLSENTLEDVFISLTGRKLRE